MESHQGYQQQNTLSIRQTSVLPCVQSTESSYFCQTGVQMNIPPSFDATDISVGSGQLDHSNTFFPTQTNEPNNMLPLSPPEYERRNWATIAADTSNSQQQGNYPFLSNPIAGIHLSPKKSPQQIHIPEMFNPVSLLMNATASGNFQEPSLAEVQMRSVLEAHEQQQQQMPFLHASLWWQQQSDMMSGSRKSWRENNIMPTCMGYEINPNNIPSQSMLIPQHHSQMNSQFISPYFSQIHLVNSQENKNCSTSQYGVTNHLTTGEQKVYNLYNDIGASLRNHSSNEYDANQSSSAANFMAVKMMDDDDSSKTITTHSGSNNFSPSNSKTNSNRNVECIRCGSKSATSAGWAKTEEGFALCTRCGSIEKSSEQHLNGFQHGSRTNAALYNSEDKKLSNSSMANSLSRTRHVCENCETASTTLWRRGQNNEVLCNACGLYLRLHTKPRPRSMRKDHIQTRKRRRKEMPKSANPSYSLLEASRALHGDQSLASAVAGATNELLVGNYSLSMGGGGMPWIESSHTSAPIDYVASEAFSGQNLNCIPSLLRGSPQLSVPMVYGENFLPAMAAATGFITHQQNNSSMYSQPFHIPNSNKVFVGNNNLEMMSSENVSLKNSTSHTNIPLENYSYQGNSHNTHACSESSMGILSGYECAIPAAFFLSSSVTDEKQSPRTETAISN